MTATKNKTCATCGRIGTVGERVERHTGVPYKAQGWVGDRFISRDRKFKATKVRKAWLCGLCFATEKLEELRAGGNNMTELEQYLADLARETVAGPVKTPTTVRAKNRRIVSRLTPETATDFRRHSEASIQALTAVLTCACEPYADVFTYHRWLAQDQQVRKGSKAYRVGRASVFCRCQTDPVREAVSA